MHLTRETYTVAEIQLRLIYDFLARHPECTGRSITVHFNQTEVGALVTATVLAEEVPCTIPEKTTAT